MHYFDYFYSNRFIIYFDAVRQQGLVGMIAAAANVPDHQDAFRRTQSRLNRRHPCHCTQQDPPIPATVLATGLAMPLWVAERVRAGTEIVDATRVQGVYVPNAYNIVGCTATP
jgi:hypothetical protein